MSNFIVQFPLAIEKYQYYVLNKRMEIGRRIYNSLINITKKRYKEMVKTREYRNIKCVIKESNAELKKELYKQLNELYKKFGMSEYSFHYDVKELQHHFKNNIDSQSAQKIASNLWRAYEKLLFGDGEKIRYKRFAEFNSFEGKSNKSGIRFKDGKLLWNGLTVSVNVKYNIYNTSSFNNDISYCRIVRKFVKNKYKFYIQIVFKGTPHTRLKLGEGNVGLDIGTQTVAISSDTDVKIYELADRVVKIEREKSKISKQMDRSRRKNNPENYNEDGTIARLGNKKMVWNKSKKYIKLQNKLKNISRKQKDVRKYQHECLANYIISLGNEIHVEDMNFKSLQKRSKKTTLNEKTGKINKKKRFGKSIANKAPAMLLSIIDRKLKYFGKELNKIDTWNVRASQYNHFDDSYKKKKLSERWNDFGETKVQRDMYSAFLIMNVNDDLKSINKDKCDIKFDNFMALHNLEVKRLTGNKNLSSIAI